MANDIDEKALGLARHLSGIFASDILGENAQRLALAQVAIIDAIVADRDIDVRTAALREQVRQFEKQLAEHWNETSVANIRSRAMAAERNLDQAYKALRPFAKAVDLADVVYAGCAGDDWTLQNTTAANQVTFGDLRRARAALGDVVVSGKSADLRGHDMTWSHAAVEAARETMRRRTRFIPDADVMRDVLGAAANVECLRPVGLAMATAYDRGDRAKADAADAHAKPEA